MHLRGYHWGIALFCALLAHFALAALFEPPAPIQLEDPGVRIALGGTGPSGGVTASTALPAGAPTSSATAAPPPTEVIRASEPKAATTVTATTPIQPRQATQPITATEPRPPAPVTPRPPAPQRTEPARTDAAPTASAPRQAAVNATPSPSDTEPSNAPATGSAGAASGGGGGTTGTDQGGQSQDRYYAELAAWLERHKRYPTHARRLRLEGVVRVRFVIDRTGRLISHRIENSSGHSALDEAASELLRRASPMPAIPPSLGQSRLEIVVPIAYRLR